jgi:hypothetical protein
MLIKVIEGNGKNPLIYLNGRLLTSHQYTLEEVEHSPAMLGWVGVYEPVSIVFSETILTGDTLIIVYPNKRYEYMLTHIPHRGTRISLRPESPVKNG